LRPILLVTTSFLGAPVLAAVVVGPLIPGAALALVAATSVPGGAAVALSPVSAPEAASTPFVTEPKPGAVG
jgi:hypothetical protein